MSQQTEKGKAWKKHNVYSKQYVDNYDRIDWGKPSCPVCKSREITSTEDKENSMTCRKCGHEWVK